MKGLIALVLSVAVLVVAMPHLGPVFAGLFPNLSHPLFTLDGFATLTLLHLWLVLVSGAASAVVGIGAGMLVSTRQGRAFRPLAEQLATIGQNIPPVAVLAVAVPAIGFGFWPAFAALALYGLLPILQNTIAGLDQVPAAVRDAAAGIGMTGFQVLRHVSLPLALPVILAGLRTSFIVNLGTAAIASTVGARTLGLPITLGLTGSNPAYVIQGALILGLLAVTLDTAFGRLADVAEAWRGGSSTRRG